MTLAEQPRNEHRQIDKQFYVYVLKDPDAEVPFHVGTVQLRPDDDFQVGIEPHEVASLSEDTSESRNKYNFSSKIGVRRTPNEIFRVVARKLDKESALAIEALLVKSVYDFERGMTILADLEASERFREANDWNYITDFDIPTNDHGDFEADTGSHSSGKYYVYVLLDPQDGQIFYVGKGQGNRLSQHFADARAKNRKSESDKLLEIRGMLDDGYKPRSIGRVVARVDSESLAFMLESFYIKFVVGFGNLHNIQPGQRSGYFRSRYDWEIRRGFETPLIIKYGSPRVDLLEKMLGEGLDTLLIECTSLVTSHLEPSTGFEMPKFSAPKLTGAGELSTRVAVPFGTQQSATADLVIFVRSARRIQCALGSIELISDQTVVRRHFTALGAYPLRRKDNSFVPLAWKGGTKAVRLAAKRALLLLRLAAATDRTAIDSDDELRPLLDGLPHAD